MCMRDISTSRRLLPVNAFFSILFFLELNLISGVPKVEVYAETVQIEDSVVFQYKI